MTSLVGTGRLEHCQHPAITSYSIWGGGVRHPLKPLAANLNGQEAGRLPVLLVRFGAILACMLSRRVGSTNLLLDSPC